MIFGALSYAVVCHALHSHAYPLWWLCATFIKNTKLCLTTGTLIWTITFICTLPNNANSIRRLATNNVLYQLLPPAMLTLAGAIKLTLDFAKRHVVAACSYIRRCALKN